MSEPIVIIGAGPAGLSAARAYREHGGGAPVTIIGREPTPPYERPPLTKDFLRGETAAEELLLEQESWYSRHDVDLRLGCSAQAIDSEHGTVQTDQGTLHAQAIVLATGSEPLRPPIEGIDHPDVLSVRELADSRRISGQVGNGTHVLVLGSGFIGCELAGSLTMIGARVSMLAQEDAPQQERLGAQAGKRIARWLGGLGVELIAGAEAEEIIDGHTIQTTDGRGLSADLILLGTGAKPRVALAEAAGADVGEGAVLVDSCMRAGGRLLAAGDVAFAHNPAAGRRLRVEHWGDALAQGKVAGKTLAGIEEPWAQVPGFWTTIGEHTLKYAAWGDGYDNCELAEHGDGAFTVWYSREGKLAGVLTSECDPDYERGRELIHTGASAP
ncbi:MAG TPA: FAD/NAD(P)-binding oxidoreductase [Solirubrobacteraceae bacterium]|nr:FAD/NAD(P)-binding oxidoreductase [Solirubrobacteraceae bacterium]